jgi:hypothetical protein
MRNIIMVVCVFISFGGVNGVDGYKYICVFNDHLSGNSCNSGNHTKDGYVYHNSNYVLTKVIAV